MHAISIAGGDPTSLCFCFGFVVVVCFLPVFALLLLVCRLFSCWDSFWSTTSTFVAFDNLTALHANYNSTVCRD